MIAKIEQLLKEVEALHASNAEELEALRIKYLSKKGAINDLMADFRNVAAEQKKEVGMRLNELKTKAQDKINALKEQFESQDNGCDGLDLTRSAYPVELGTRHPLTIVKNEIIDILKERRTLFKDNSIEDFFLGMFNNKLSVALLKVGKMGSFNRKCNDISNKEIENLAGIINEFDFVTTGKNDYSKSQVTCGGVSGKEINTNTLESLYIPNLYFCGEIIDIDGICGGYNLQFAFASGMKAGALE